MAELRKFATATTILFPLLDGGATEDFEDTPVTFASGDTLIMKDEGAFTSTISQTVHEGQGIYSLALASAELSAARIVITIRDLTATEAWADQGVSIETYGNASAEHPFDLGTASVPQTADHTAGIADIPTVAELEARTIVAASYFDPAADTVATVTDVTNQVTAAANADAVWDELLTGSSHNIATSAGRRLRQIEEAFVHANGVIATVTNGHTFTLDAGAVATADYYIGDRLQITEGTGAGQSRLIVAYTSGRVVTLDSDYTTNPDTSSLYEVDAADVHVSISDADLAQGFLAAFTNTTTVTLDAGAEATTDFYVGELLIITHGTGMGQAREITAYTSGRVCTLSPALISDLDTTSVWHIQAVVSIPEIVDEILDEALSGHTTAGTVGKAITDTETAVVTDIPALLPAALVGGRMDSNVGAISADATAADRLEAAMEGVVTGAAEAGTLSTTQMTTDLTEATDDHFKGRIVTWRTGLLTGASSDITAYLGSTGRLTYTATTDAPSAGDTFVIT